MLKEHLRKKALEIGNIPPDYELEIEDYDEKQKTKAYYIWKDRNHPDKTVTIELGDDGSLLTYSRNDCPGSDMQLSDAELKLTALRFAARHRPLTFMNFIFQAREERNGCIRFIYTKKVLGRPLPDSGFFVDVTRSGFVVQFIYYGDKGEAPVPETFVDREKVVSHYMSVLTFSLVYDVVNFEKIPRLVYEPILPAYSYPAGEDDIVPDQQLCEDRNEPAKPLPAFEHKREISLDELMGFTSDMVQTRRRDLGDEIGTTWRKGSVPERKDLSIESYFESSNKNTMKMKTDKKSGKMTAFKSFIEHQGPAFYSAEECEAVALQFLYKLYPRADEFFKMNPLKTDGRGRFRFHFSIWHQDIPLRFGAARILVSPVTGLVEAYMAPDIDPEQLEKINPVPAVTPEEAKAAFLSDFHLRLEWQRDFTPSGNEGYKLVYRPVYPPYIDAQKRKKKRFY
ncbi:YcdB/YcdC domain-containing protein [Bacillus velezensis]|uniref:YcdB/YcdC domain-containing protein n=1 Tax=Bacillus TaxID=1386 RepID=UPI0003872E5D|nr:MULTISPECIES: YcdB/YcdC domain-containing protein [Bacillus]AWG39873.1 DUF4901 domain-containing protein [Bacillus velezensis]AZJ42104.1 DUF4901 domain-containing protein [Bacillus velezensis]MBC2599111.1 DUF4901 domain-containing protein [Bacillus velezensis]MCM3371785.1 DUF4901 domain-containing protein [Bacillus velezensis]MEC1701363.1 DUF4901 domain-containing protein [Bacillus velezensis]